MDDAYEELTVIDGQAGKFYASEITARHTSPKEYLEARAYFQSYIDQISIWVPFHFLPGGKGDDLTEKLVCCTDSEISREMVEGHVQHACKHPSWGNHLIGIAAHVYADTFAHYGFSGISSRRNLVDQSSIKEEKEDRDESWLSKIKSGFEEIEEFPNIRNAIIGYLGENATKIEGGTMGHGGVGKLPDWPFLVYSFDYEHPRHSGLVDASSNVRNNPGTYLNFCQKIHEYFNGYARQSGQQAPTFDKPFEEIQDDIAKILSHREESSKKRMEHWQLESKRLWDLDIPDYREGGDSWIQKFQNSGNADDVEKSDAYLFYCAASYHKRFVLTKLLPKHGIEMKSRQFRSDGADLLG